MRKLLLLIVIFAGLSTFAQSPADTTKNWKIYGLGSLSLNQASFSNWSAGGENSYSVTAIGKLYADYTKNRFSINNSLTLKYGVQKNESDNSAKKNEDLVELISQFNHKVSKNWSVSAQLNFNTQMTDGYNYPDDSTVVSSFMAPGYLNLAPGVLYKPVEYFSILISPATVRGIFVLDQELANVGAYGVNPAEIDTTSGEIISEGDKSKIKLGGFVEFYFKKNFDEKFSLESRMSFFYNYLQDNNIPDGKMPLDFNWQTFMNYKVTSWLSANLFVHMVYMPGDVFIDREVLKGDKKPLPNDKLQVLQTFGVGLAYNF